MTKYDVKIMMDSLEQLMEVRLKYEMSLMQRGFLSPSRVMDTVMTQALERQRLYDKVKNLELEDNPIPSRPNETTH